MSRSIRDLPLTGDASSRFLPWIVSFMLYLAGLALAGVMFVSAAGAEWRSGLSDTVTVQIMPPEDVSGDAARTREFDKRTATALKLLRASRGVASATRLSDGKVRALVEPWLGPGASLDELPLPRLIDVRMSAESRPDTAALADNLARNVPGAALDDHGVWLARLQDLARAVEWVAIAVLALISAAAVLTIVFATRTGLSIHRDVVEVLHLAGAKDSYVARQFQAHALRLTLKGGVVGTVAAALTLLSLQYVARDLDATLLPAFALTPTQWVALAATPFVAGAVSVVTARITVLRSLGRMP